MKYPSAVLFVFALAWTALNVQAGNFVGIILSGYEKNCEVTHNQKVYDCEDRRELFMGDVVKKKPSVKALKIKWAPFVMGEARGRVPGSGPKHGRQIQGRCLRRNGETICERFCETSRL